jgi:glycosyltransferase involved in cell wall biosynthesis
MSELPPLSEMSATTLPKVTIAIPTLNRVDYLRLALESSIRQTYGNIEVVVSNNASTDGTANYLKSCTDPRIHILHQTKLLPMTENWNACLAAATGEYFLLLSDDDLLEPEAIQELVSGYEQHYDNLAPGVVYCGGCFINSAGDVIGVFRHSPTPEAAWDLIPAFFEGKRDLYICAALLRTSDIFPGFSTTYKTLCDVAVWVRATMRRGPAVFIPKQLAHYRVHQSLSYSTPLDVSLADYRHLYKLTMEEDKKANTPDPAFGKKMWSAMQRCEQALIIDRINGSFRKNKGRGLLEYSHYLSSFVGVQGMISLCKGIMTLFLTERTRTWLRQKLRKRPALVKPS